MGPPKAPDARTLPDPGPTAARDRYRNARRTGALLVAAASLLCLGQRPLGAQDADVDRDYVLPLVNQVLETERTDVEVPWLNPETGNSGTIVVERTFYLEPGKPCREYRRSLERAASPAIVIEGTGCRTGPEQWDLDEEEPSPVRVDDPGAAPPAGATVSDPGAPAGCPPAETAESSEPEPPAFADFTMPAKARL